MIATTPPAPLPPATAVPFWDTAQAWLAEHSVIVAVIGGVSVVLSLGAMLLTPFVVGRLPVDFFVRLTQPPAPVLQRAHPARVIGRNLLGAFLVLLGILLVPLPGPGGLVALLGLAVADFPGKRPLLTTILRRPLAMASINWLRRRAGCEPMLTPGPFVKRHPAERAVAPLT